MRDLWLRKQQEVQAEYGEHFIDVLRGFREQHQTWDTIGAVLEIKPQTLRRWAKRLGLQDGKWESSGLGPHRLDNRAEVAGYKNTTELVRAFLNNKLPLSEAAKVIQAHPRSLLRYIPIEFKGQLHSLKTPKRLAYHARLRQRQRRVI